MQHQIIIGLQTVVSCDTNPIEPLVISVTKFNAVQAYKMAGSVRTLVPGLRDFAERQILASAEGIAHGFGAHVEFNYCRSCPVTFNHTKETNVAIKAARKIVEAACMDDKIKPRMSSEDFAFMLEERPGALIGNGSTPGLHYPAYDFNDEALPYGIGYWVNLVETALAI